MKKKNTAKNKSSLKVSEDQTGKPWAVLLIILALTILVYFPVFKNELVNWDDHAYIRDNVLIRDLSLQNIKHLFHTSTYVIGNYHPLTVLSYCVEYKIFGLNPAGYHATNLFLHLLNISLFFYFMLLLSGKRVLSYVSSFLFALHPMRVESVAWAAERKDVLYMFFFLLSLLCYFYYITKNKNQVLFYALSFLLFLFSCFSKGQAVVLPLTFFLVDYFIKRPFSLKSILSKLPFFILSIIFGIIAISAQHTSLTEQRLETYTFLERMLFASYNIIAYLYKLLAPYDLACFYSYPIKINGAFPLIFYIAPLLLLLLAFVSWKFFRKNHYIIFGLLFFLFTVSIVIQILPVGDAIIADRYTYIPYMGLFFIIGYAIDALFTSTSAWILKNRKVFSLALVFQACIFCFFSFTQVKSWKNSETLWTKTLENNPHEPVAYYDRGMHYLENNMLDKALSDFQNAIRYKPIYFEAYNSIGTVYEKRNENEKALEYYGKSLAIQPFYTNAAFNRGLTYNKISKFDSAVVDFTYVIKLEPKNPNAYYSRGLAFKSLRIYDKAIADYSTAIALNPNFVDAYVNLGNVYYNQNLFDKAIELYSRAMQIDPKNAKAYMNRSSNYYMKKDFLRALEDAKAAQMYGENVDPKYIEVLQKEISQTHSP